MYIWNIIVIVLTIGNTLTLFYILMHNHFSVHKNTSFGKNTLMGYRFYYKGKGFFYIPIKNQRKTELREDVQHMINCDTQSKTQKLHAIFSWLKTVEEVEQFKKDYEVVDRRLVHTLVREFKIKDGK